jgi:uncharacterized protein (TIGR00255 family)
VTAVRGMTGFGRADGADGLWSWTVEARSVNGRTLEVRTRAPPGFDALEARARELAQARFARGQVAVSVQARRAGVSAGPEVDKAALERLLELARPYVESGRAAPPRFDGLLRAPGVLREPVADDSPETRAGLETALATSLACALDALAAARAEEGAALSPVLEGAVDRIAGLVRRGEAEAGGQGPAIKARYAARLQEFAGEHLPPERIAQEAAALAQRADVREELDRLVAHVASARALLADPAPVGRRLDFLSQEFMREANTLCAKSASSELTATGLELKAAIEQFREQVQNVE